MYITWYIIYVKGVIVSIMGCLAAAEGTIAASARKLVSTINHISVLFWYSEQQINLTSLLNLWTGLLFWWYVWQKVETTVNCKQNGSVSGGHGWLAEVNGDTGGGWGVPWLGVPLCHYSQHCQCGAHHQHNLGSYLTTLNVPASFGLNVYSLLGNSVSFFRVAVFGQLNMGSCP